MPKRTDAFIVINYLFNTKEGGDMEELLSKTNIPKEYYEFCYVKDGNVYPPLVENGTVIKTGEERYKEKFEKPQLTLWQKIKKGVGLK